ncbi:MAG: non-canonical purine NTP pyrophosphatase [Gemmatimonadales bacterium]|nr:non-canonical purine NTP pyrophosphatase [Candidatus Palauibacter denitrificans]
MLVPHHRLRAPAAALYAGGAGDGSLPRRPDTGRGRDLLRAGPRIHARPLRFLRAVRRRGLRPRETGVQVPAAGPRHHRAVRRLRGFLHRDGRDAWRLDPRGTRLVVHPGREHPRGARHGWIPVEGLPGVRGESHGGESLGGLNRPPVLVATRSAHKLREIRGLLADLPIRLLGPEDLGLPEHEEEDDLEPFDTFARNALSKAKYFHRRSGLPVLADDSGLCVDALGGGPGVRTRRFAPPDRVVRWGRDEANNRWLLERLQDVDAGRRGAHYRCAVALTDDLRHEVVEGIVRGRIARRPSGSGGFGYDPLFVPEGHDRTYAELPAAVKTATSHRAKAIRQARGWIEREVLR